MIVIGYDRMNKPFWLHVVSVTFPLGELNKVSKFFFQQKIAKYKSFRYLCPTKIVIF